MFGQGGLLMLFLASWALSQWLGEGLLLAVLAAVMVWHWRKLQSQIDELREQVRALQARLASRASIGEPGAEDAVQRRAAPPRPPAVHEPAPGPAAPEPVRAPEPRPVAAAVRPAPAARPQPKVWPQPPEAIDEHSPAVTASLGASLLAWFSGGNTIVRLAVLILFMGVAFLVRYAAENALLPLELRLAATALGGLALSGVGWRLREKRRAYGLTLQGAGVGGVYLVLFAAFRLYALLPAGVVFALMLLLGAGTVWLALRQNAMPLAALAFAGGFAAPVLTSTGQGSHVALLSFYLMLNLGIAWIALYKPWKLLNAMGFAFTFGVSLAWGLKHWRPEFLFSSELLLIAHLALYLFITVQYSRNLLAVKDARLPLVDGGLLFAVPLAAFGLQAGMVEHIPYALAASAAVLAGVYGLLARWLTHRAGPGLALLSDGFLALGVVFLALVAPLALEGAWVSSSWALQGAGMLWVALRQRRAVALLLGLLLQGLALLLAWGDMSLRLHSQPHWLWNPLLLGALLAAAAVGFSALQLQRAALRWRAEPPPALQPGARWQAWLEAVFEPEPLHNLHWGLLSLATLHTVVSLVQTLAQAPWSTPSLRAMACLTLLTLALACEAAHRRLAWRALAQVGRVLLALALGMEILMVLASPMFTQGGWRFWRESGGLELVLLLAGGLWLLHRLDHDPARPRGSRALEHLLVLGLSVAGVGSLAYAVGHVFIGPESSWSHALLLAAPLLWMHSLLAGQRAGRWPMARHAQALQWGLAWPLLGLGLLWVAGVNLLSDGGIAPLPFVPLLNPLDLAHGLLLFYGVSLWRHAPPPVEDAHLWRWLLAGSGFGWMNAAAVRTLHHWAGTPMWLDGALGSSLVQTTLSLLWTLCALLCMAWGSWRSLRPLWMAGAALLGAVVFKLLLVDMSQSGALMRIVSFMGVGLLMLLIGYLAPLPPARKAQP